MFSSGYEARLNVEFKISKNTLDYKCREAQGFKVLIHNPSEVPRFSMNFVRMPFDQDFLVAVKPKMITTSNDLRDYDPHQRGCYFDGEYQLRFFKVYNQNNCELECLSNYIKKECGCVKFSFPSNTLDIFIFHLILVAND